MIGKWKAKNVGGYMPKPLLWMYAGINVNGDKKAGAGLTTAQIAKITAQNWLVLDVRSYTTEPDNIDTNFNAVPSDPLAEE